jgi:hypothetical protein
VSLPKRGLRALQTYVKRPKPEAKLVSVVKQLYAHEASNCADFLARMCIVPDWKLKSYHAVFDSLKEGGKSTIGWASLQRGLEAICTQNLRHVEIKYTSEVLDLVFDGPEVTAEQFSTAAALTERISAVGPELRTKMRAYDGNAAKEKAVQMFLIDAGEDGTVSLEDLGLMFDAGRVPAEQKRAIVKEVRKTGNSVNFLDYLTYLPYFVDVHQKILSNSLRQRSVIVEEAD